MPGSCACLVHAGLDITSGLRYYTCSWDDLKRVVFQKSIELILEKLKAASVKWVHLCLPKAIALPRTAWGASMM